MNGIRIVVSQALIGSKCCFGDSESVMVSPAMWDLIKHSTGDELKDLLSKIPMKHFPLTACMKIPSLAEMQTPLSLSSELFGENT